MSIVMIPVESSQIDSIGHDPRHNAIDDCFHQIKLLMKVMEDTQGAPT